MIVSSGYNIAGPEVEAALLGHAAVAELLGKPEAAVRRAAADGMKSLRVLLAPEDKERS